MEANGKQWANEKLRVTILTTRLLRVEWEKFTDEKTQMVMCRDFDPAMGQFRDCGDYLAVRTKDLQARISLKDGHILGVKLKPDAEWNTNPVIGRHSEEPITSSIERKKKPEETQASQKKNFSSIICNFSRGNLLGTARTLDKVNGSTRLEPGIMSRSGVALVDDSKSLLLVKDPEEEIKLLPRKGGKDHYLFAYGEDYRQALKDFYQLTGPVPLIPRYALGNWWSRYKAYTQQEYVDLILRFEEKRIPLTVATIDMDWHWVNLKEKFQGSFASDITHPSRTTRIQEKYMPGWTGYSWNTDLFPDHKAMLDWLHEHHLKVTLNIHPAQGVRWFEDKYEELCVLLGWNPAERKPIPFRLLSKKERELYFEKLHRPLEKEGVDFWWIDWQQGTQTDIEGLDPLWLLNHFHYLDNQAEGKRPLILSRYSGLGSHRYPLGFSGDVVVSWKSLNFQPYFTANAANAGYTWWSHDIGGHMQGSPDEELYLRWIQLGVFSPINRLHSADCEYMSKEPWLRTRETEKIVTDYLRFRHAMIPYLYSADYQTAFHGIPICEPMYYQNPGDKEAYQVRNEYHFGPSLIAAPITRPVDPKTEYASVRVWIPEGRFTDIFTSQIYEGPRMVTMYREKSYLPVLAKEGAVIPLYHQSEKNDISNNQPHDIWIYRGNGSFDWYEDDGETENYRQGDYLITRITVEELGESQTDLVEKQSESQTGLVEKQSESQAGLVEKQSESQAGHVENLSENQSGHVGKPSENQSGHVGNPSEDHAVSAKKHAEGNMATLRVQIEPIEGKTSLVPESRQLTLCFRDLSDAAAIFVNGKKTEFRKRLLEDGRKIIETEIRYENQKTEILVWKAVVLENLPLRQEGIRRYTQYQTRNFDKIISSRIKTYEHFDRRGNFPGKMEAELEELRALWRPDCN